MILGGTGHRPTDNEYILPNPTYIYLSQQIEKHILELKPDKIISGMAIGYDIYLANIAIKLGIPLIAAVPFKGQERRWSATDQKRYFNILSKADEIHYSGSTEFSSFTQLFYLRNQYIVDNSDIILAYWDGRKTGGTYNCIEYARENSKDIRIIPPRS